MDKYHENIATIDNWLQNEVAAAYYALKANPSRALTAEHVRNRLAAEYGKNDELH